MKRVLLIILLIVGLITPPCVRAAEFEFYVFNVNLKWLKEATLKDYGVMLLGACSNVIVHELIGHIGYLEAKDIDYEFDMKWNCAVSEITAKNVTRSQARNHARAGYVASALGGLILTSLPQTRDSYYTRGYTGFEATSLPIYNSVFDGEYNDFKTLKKNGGNEDLFKGIIAGISAHNLLRQEW